MAKPSFIATTVANVKNSPREIFNWYIIVCTCLWSFSGVAKGFDEGNIASLVVMKAFKLKFGLASQSDSEYANTKGWIVSIATAGAVFGCIFCIHLTTILGRRLAFQIFTVVYIAGVLGQTFSNGNLSGLYASRFIAGMGIGVTTILPSIYLAEISPSSIRGLVTLQYACCQQLGVVFGFFFNYGITKSFAGSNLQWQLPTVLQVIPAIIWGLGSFLTPESPRFLLNKGRRSEALTTLARLRGMSEDHQYVQDEFNGIETQLSHEADAVAGVSFIDAVKETFGPITNRRRFFLMFFAHLFAQWSGANAITQYSPTIFGYLGIEGQESSFLATGIYAIVKFVSTLVFSVVGIDFIGRRRSLMTGITLQIVTLTYVGAYLGVTNGRSSTSIASDSSAIHASQAAIVAIYLHAVAWSVGWFSIPYLVSSEVFPIRIRSPNVSALMAFHWAFYFGCSRAMPSLLAATDRYGAFAFFASICCISLVYVFFAMPETAGRSLESMDSLFDRPWYTVWKVAYPKPEELLQGHQRDDEDDLEVKPHVSHKN
ncbi:general substrate transporter [Hypoxylon trugodes]|uniref:general substrate transporter n=1 Tax=Hypoxylon trugodes TaxID=326681 RepID=UPI00218DD74F|nr:general substrate transporter [Hypoxylon trugodes]KAI1393114.1 general substrate transporter [Hypoxylon trugodes]